MLFIRGRNYKSFFWDLKCSLMKQNYWKKQWWFLTSFSVKSESYNVTTKHFSLAEMFCSYIVTKISKVCCYLQRLHQLTCQFSRLHFALQRWFCSQYFVNLNCCISLIKEALSKRLTAQQSTYCELSITAGLGSAANCHFTFKVLQKKLLEHKLLNKTMKPLRSCSDLVYLMFLCIKTNM